MPNTKKVNQKTTAGKTKRNTGNNKGQGMHHAEMPHIPTARERAKDMDSSRRANAQTFEL